MNRIDFMNQLESLLQNIAPAEREEALQYYNCYFDDAGQENEREVLEALGTPAKVAENIKRDLLANSSEEAASRKVKASDRALMEYGKSSQNDSEEQDTAALSGNMQKAPESAGMQKDGDNLSAYSENMKSSSRYAGNVNNDGGYAGNGSRNSNYSENSSNSYSTAGTYSTADQGSSQGSSWAGYGYGYQDQYGDQSQRAYEADGTQLICSRSGQAGQPGSPGKGLPGWAVALIVAAVVLFSPAAAGVVAGAFGILTGWFGMIIGFGVASVVLLIILVILVVVGFLCFFVNPWVGCALMGGGLLCGALGIVFLMLTVAMAGIVTPAIFRGIAGLFRRIKGAR